MQKCVAADLTHMGTVRGVDGLIEMLIHYLCVRQQLELIHVGRAEAGGFVQQILAGGFLSPASGPVGPMNAVKFTPGSGTLNNMFLTVKGVV